MDQRPEVSAIPDMSYVIAQVESIKGIKWDMDSIPPVEAGRSRFRNIISPETVSSELIWGSGMLFVAGFWFSVYKVAEGAGRLIQEAQRLNVTEILTHRLSNLGF